MVAATIAIAREKARVPLEGDQGFFASPVWGSRLAFSRLCCLERTRLRALPSVSFLTGLFVRMPDSSLSDHLAEIQGLLCPRGTQGGLEGEGGGSFTLERISSPDSRQGKAGPSIERSSSCMRAEHANSIEHDPSPQPAVNKVIFPDLLRQKGGTHVLFLC